jgi:hypothetical protein
MVQYDFMRFIRQSETIGSVLEKNRFLAALGMTTQKVCEGHSELIAQGFAGFEGVGDALLSFLLSTERHKGFALEIQHVLLADRL